MRMQARKVRVLMKLSSILSTVPSLVVWTALLFGQSDDTFDPDRLETFQNDFTYEQIVVVDTALGKPLPESGGVIPPPGMLNFFPIVFTNNTGLDASRLYVLGKGQTIAATNAYFLQPDTKTGVCTLVAGSSANSVDSNISVQLSQLPSAGTNSYYMYVPQLISGRMYVSVDSPLYLETAVNQSTGYFAINDPSQTTTNDPNYYFLYQDFEFTLDSFYNLYANVTNVDYFALPMTLGSHTYPSGAFYPTLDNLTIVGYPLTLGRNSILQSISSGLSSGDASSPPQWSSLVIPFYNNPYAVSSPATDLRIIAAKLSITLATSYLFQGAANTQTFFSSTYLENASTGPSAGKSYMQALYSHYASNQTSVQIFPANQPTATYNITADTSGSGMTNLTLDLNLQAGTGGVAAPTLITVLLNNLTTEDLLGGDIGAWVGSNAITPTSTDPWQTEVAKIFSALFTAGMLPPATTVANPIVSDSSYFSTYRGSFFSNPPGFSLYGPWYNLYDKLIHPLLIQTGGFGLGYAYDFDDLLDLAGLLHVIIQTNGVLNSDQPYVQLSLGPVDTTVPNPKVNYGPYTLTVNPISSMSNAIDVIYSTSASSPPNQTYQVGTTMPQSFSNVENYFTVKYYNSQNRQTASIILEYNVYPKYQLVLPVGNRYNAEDVALMNGIVFQTGTNGSTFIISLPNTNPFP
jgi:hypothetical protein